PPALERGLAEPLQAAGDRAEDALQIGADGGHRRDRRNRNKGGDQAVFDRGGAALVAEDRQGVSDNAHRGNSSGCIDRTELPLLRLIERKVRTLNQSNE